MKKRILKGIALYLALSIFFQVTAPTLALALTTGPGQPEMTSFEPVGTTQMVDAFSGDFNYNIPLMTVPGPNGGYPINIAYHSGIGMEDEASWVGLGWNISPGVINRQMRGLPDDFNGDVVTREMNMNPNRTITVGTGLSAEFAGFAMERSGMSLSTQFIWNNYKGIGSTHSFGYNPGSGASLAPSVSFNTFGGMEFSASLSYQKSMKGRQAVFSGKATLSSNEGLKEISVNAGIDSKKTIRTKYTPRLGDSYWIKKQVGVNHARGGVSFSGSSFVPHANLPTTGFNAGYGTSFGAAFATSFIKFKGDISYTESRLKNNNVPFNAYGYLYSESRKPGSGTKHSLMDFNREKDVNLVKDIPSMPVPVFTNDVYVIKGQGIGGYFRPYRSDIGILHDPEIESEINGGYVGMGFGMGVPMQFDTDLHANLSRSYSGPWQNSASWLDLKNYQQFKGHNAADPLYEPFYFRAAGDMAVTMDDDYNRVNGGNFDFKTIVNLDDMLEPNPANHSHPLVDFKIKSNSVLEYSVPSYNSRQKRKARSQYMSYKTAGQMRLMEDYVDRWTKNVYGADEFPRNATPSAADYSSGGIRRSDHIGEISVINPDGNRYIYGISAYNKSQEEVSFSVSPQYNSPGKNEKLVPFSTTDASVSNQKGDDHFYSSTQMGGYAHSYLLTAIVSPDYVDLTGDGLSEDDYGYWVKFNYTLTNTAYHWRAPYTKANYLKGYNSLDLDDKAGFTYGIKEIWYLTSIETKTHVAEFTLSDREDGYGADGRENQTAVYSNSQKLKKLDKISLYSKVDNYYGNETPKPVKVVHFEYTYDLCGNVENNKNSVTTFVNDASPGYPSVSILAPYSDQPPAGSGKLTLKKIWFTYGNNDKGSLSPYLFDYEERTSSGDIALATNPNYDPMQTDRWGNYKPYGYGYKSTADYRYNPYEGTAVNNPYVNQKKDFTGNGTADEDDVIARNNAVSAWCLKKIVLPSGGEIKVEYESDDYAFVQDKPAMQMMKIIGLEDSGLSTAASLSNEIRGKNWYVYFELEDQDVSSDADIYKYVAGINEMYFKAYERLTPTPTGHAYDYVEGYAEIDNSGTGYYGLCTLGGTKKVGWVKLKKTGVQDVKVGNIDFTHPFRKAGWQYLKLNRPDLIYPAGNNTSDDVWGSTEVTQVANSVQGFVNDALMLLTGFYNACIIKGYCDEVLLDPDSTPEQYRPSFIRLNSPDGIKYGGGHRVKRLTINDTWAQSESGTNPSGEAVSEYGQEYFYRLADGRSSGVAEYEPLIGGEEIPHHMPVRYSSPFFLLKHDDLYLEKPIGESYFPGAGVGYSRVVVKSIKHNEGIDEYGEPVIIPTTASESGITEYEFYTARDFPVLVNAGNVNKKSFTPKFPIPFIGLIGFDDRAFSQRISVETNDMHGKARAVSTYPARADLFNVAVIPKPVTRVEYIYNTDNAYTPVGYNHLKNDVDVLYADAYYKKSEMGVNKEFFIDMREESNTSAEGGADANIFYTPPYFFFPSVTPAVVYNETVAKSIVAMDVVNRNGILMETHSYDGASMVTSKNLMFDAATGAPLLTTLTNDFENPVYTYNYAAHWSYDGMGTADKTTGAYFPYPSGITSGNVITVASAPAYLSVGDEIVFHTATVSPAFYVTAVSSSSITLKARDGVTAVPAGGTGYYFLIDRSARRNQQSVSSGNIVSLSNPVTERIFPLFYTWNDILDKTGDIPDSFTFTDCGTGRVVTATWKVGTNGTTFTITYPSGETCRSEFIYPAGTTFPGGFENYTLQKIGNKVIATHGSTVITGTWRNDGGCLSECVPDVLHASASVYKDDWTTELASVLKDVNTNNLSGVSHPDATDMNNDPLFYGGQGTWRNWQSYVFQVDRKQSSPATDISKDGTYDRFVTFDWTDYSSNPKWTKSGEVTRYSPYGFELENKDPLNIYQSALYGYNNALVTAVSANSPYFETAYDGFEDYYNVSTNSSGYALNKGHGHLNLMYPSSTAIAGHFADFAHTGKRSLEIPSGSGISFTTGVSTTDYFRPELITPSITSSGYKEKQYLISAWISNSNAYNASSVPSIGITGGATVVSTNVSPEIEGWKKVDVVFKTTNASISNIVFTFSVSGTPYTAYLDDVRIVPYKGTIKSYAYDPKTLWLMAELDNQNFATFYNYDEEGTLVQVKKETEKGIMTIKTTRGNIKQ